MTRSSDTPFEIGAAKADITAFEEGLGLFGWAYPDNVAMGVAMPLTARAFVLRAPDTDARFAFVVADLGYLPHAVRQAVLDRLSRDHAALGLGEANVMLTATHTHSAPGGLSHYFFYCAAAQGYSAHVFAKVVDGVVDAIVEADARRRPGRVALRSGEISLDVPVAFNRCIEAHNANRDVIPKLRGHRSPAAVDRGMVLLGFDDVEGRPIGALSFFGVHGTSVHRDNQLLHPDNKGCAAAAMERRMAAAHAAPDFVAGFAQAPAGDVTPNFRRDRARGLVIGEADDDFESARANGDHQFRQAYRLLESAGPDDVLAPTLDTTLIYADLAEVELAPAFSAGQRGARTSPAEIGLRMIFGTEEGPGLPYFLTPPVERVARLWRRWQRAGQLLRLSRLPGARRAASQAGKLGLLDTGRGPHARIVGLLPVARSLPLPDAVHPIVAYAKRVVRRGGLGQQPLTPRVLPLQIAILDRLAIVAVPGEPTTVAGRRLRQSVLQRLASRGVTQVVVCPYSNSYAGYITTPEEYDRQAYEGASTHFGRWTLGAYQTRFDELGRRLLTPPSRRSVDLGCTPPRFEPELLAARAFEPRAS